MNPEWFYSVGDTRQGPVTEDELQRLAADGTLKPADLVWKDGMADWAEARTIEALFPRSAARRDDDYIPTSRRGGDDDRRWDRDRSDDDRPRSRRDDDGDRPRSRRTYDERDDYDDQRRPRRGRKPSQVQPIAIMFLVGGIFGILMVLTIGGATCCLWPAIYFELVWAIMAIVRASNMLGADDQPHPTAIAVCQIITILNGDIVNCILGIVCLVMLNDEKVAAYYGRRN